MLRRNFHVTGTGDLPQAWLYEGPPGLQGLGPAVSPTSHPTTIPFAHSALSGLFLPLQLAQKAHVGRRARALAGGGAHTAAPTLVVGIETLSAMPVYGPRSPSWRPPP